MYKSLELALKVQASTPAEFEWFKMIVGQYFEGDLKFEDLPGVVQQVVGYWEIEQREEREAEEGR